MKRITLTIALTLAATACGGGGGGSEGDSDPPAVATDRVDLPKSYRFDPEAIRVDVGTTVTWTNQDDFPHNVHLLDGSDTTLALPIGESVTQRFDDAGAIEYECSLHPQQMRGRVIVEG